MSLRSVVLWLGASAVIIVAVLGAVVYVQQATRPAQDTGTSTVLKRGNYGAYLYVVEAAPGNKKLVQFEPSLATDNGVVIPGLRMVAMDALGVEIREDTQPVVENRDDTNYITFAASSGRVWCELFRNSSGRVGSVRLWLEP